MRLTLLPVSVHLLASLSYAWVNPLTLSRASPFSTRTENDIYRRSDYASPRGTSLGSSTSLSASGGMTTEIIGSGRIGSLLAQADNCRVLGRDDAISDSTDSVGNPILVCTRNDALEGIVDACPASRRADLVFLQNGYLDNFLASKGLLDNTQVLLYLSKASMEAPAVDGVTSANPEGLTAATGKHAQAFADRLAALDLKCKVMGGMQEYRPAMFEKLIWISTYMLVGTAKGCSSVGQAGSDYRDVVESVITELVAAVSQKEGIAFENIDAVITRLMAYTDVVADFPCAVKEFEWRNEYFYQLGDDAVPIHNALLRECAANGSLDFEL